MSEPERALPDFLLLPGMMCDERLWTDMAPLLAPYARLHYGDLSQDATLAAMAERVLAAAPERFHLCGFSMGGYVAREIAAAAPGRVESLVLVNTSSRGTTDSDRRRRRDIAALAQARPFNGLTRANLEKSVHPGRAGDTALLGHIQDMARGLGKTVFVRQLVLERADGKPVLAGITCPTLVVAARDDLLRSVAESEILAESIPCARLAVVEDCGHMTPLERPDALAQLMIDWLSR